MWSGAGGVGSMRRHSYCYLGKVPSAQSDVVFHHPLLGKGLITQSCALNSRVERQEAKRFNPFVR